MPNTGSAAIAVVVLSMIAAAWGNGILVNTVLPFGYSRMVTSTLGEVESEALRQAAGLLRAIEPELVVPMVTFLTSRSCQLTHHHYSTCAGRFARVLLGLGPGWAADPRSGATAEVIAAHIAEVSATEPFIVPMSIFDEIADTCERLGITA